MDQIAQRFKEVRQKDEMITLDTESYASIMQCMLDYPAKAPEENETEKMTSGGFFSYFQQAAAIENGEYIAQYARDSISNLALKGSGHFDDPVLNLSLLSYLTTLSITNISIHKLFNLNLTQLTQLSLIFDIASDWTDLTISKFANGGLSIFPGVIELKLVNCLSRALLDNCPSVSSLDLSGNEKLDHVSSVVNCLTELTSLDMGDNGIESLSGLSCDLSGRIADLSRITVLRIARNELENLEGIERLNSLVFLDVSDNKIEITQEIGRLANLAHVSEIVIRGNPLTNLDNYRINIFQYFKTRALDLKIDDSLLTPSEKRFVLANITVDSTNIKTLSIPNSNSPQSESLFISKSGKSRKNRNKSKRVVADFYSESKKEHMPAISSSPVGSGDIASDGGSSRGRQSPDVKFADRSRKSSVNMESPTPTFFSAVGSAPSSLPSPLHAPADYEGAVLDNGGTDEVNEDVIDDGNELRRKIEKLKAEGGSGWMSAYSEAMAADDDRINPILLDQDQLEVVDQEPPLKENEEVPEDISKELEEEVDIPASSSTPLQIPVDVKTDESPACDSTELPSESIEISELPSDTSISTQSEPESHQFSIPKPRYPLTKSKSNNIPSIGPYRKLFEFPDNDDGRRVKFDRVESGSASAFPGLRITTPIVVSPPPLLVLGEVSLSKSLPTASLFRVGGSSTSGGGKTTPPLYLSRPVDSDGGAKYTRSNSTYSIAQSSLQSFRSNASSVYTREMNNQSSIPRVSSIPLMKLSNSLRLYLQFNVFNDAVEVDEEIVHWQIQTHIDEEREGIWMNESDVHLPDETCPTGFAYILSSTTQAAPAKKPSLIPRKLLSLFSPGKKVDASVEDIKPSRNRVVSTGQINSLVPIERPCYTLVSTSHLYIFSPLYPFPYGISCLLYYLVSNNSSDPYAQYVRAARSQFTYDDDPGRYIRLRYKFSLDRINRVIIGPGDQYYCIDYGAGTSSSRIVVLIRDGEVMTEIIEAFGKVGMGSVVERYSCAGIGWWDTAFADAVRLKPGDASRILFNGIDERVEVDYLHSYVETVRNEESRGRKSSGSLWIPYFLSTEVEDVSPVVVRDGICKVIADEEEDTSGACKLYLLVGLIVPTSGTSDSSPPIVRSCSLACTDTHIYFLLERHDCWPASSSDTKGNITDLVSTRILRVARQIEIVKLERWKSWRWTTSEITQIGADATREACVIVNGVIGVATPWKDGGGRTRGTLLDGSLGAGNAGGWEWLVRVQCKRGEMVWWIDVVFVSINSADLFCEMVGRDVEVLLGDD